MTPFPGFDTPRYDPLIVKQEWKAAFQEACRARTVEEMGQGDKAGWVDPPKRKKSLETGTPTAVYVEGRAELGGHTDLMAPLSNEEVEQLAFPVGKAAGPDEVTAEMVEMVRGQITGWMRERYDEILSTGVVPVDLKQSRVHMLVKPGAAHPGDPAGRRPITLISVWLKALQAIMARRFQRWCLEREVFGPEQFGFLEGRHMETPIATMMGVITEATLLKKHFHICGLDIQKAYDTVSKEALWEALERIEVGPRFLEYIKNLYTGRHSRVITAYGETDQYEAQRGISQGDPLSCLLFIAFMERILDQIRTHQSSGSQTKDGRHVLVQAFADDIMHVGHPNCDTNAKYYCRSQSVVAPGRYAVELE